MGPRVSSSNVIFNDVYTYEERVDKSRIAIFKVENSKGEPETGESVSQAIVHSGGAQSPPNPTKITLPQTKSYLANSSKPLVPLPRPRSNPIPSTASHLASQPPRIPHLFLDPCCFPLGNFRQRRRIIGVEIRVPGAVFELFGSAAIASGARRLFVSRLVAKLSRVVRKD